MRVGGDKCGVFCKESLDGMDGISTDLPFGVLEWHFYGFAIWCARANVAGQRREISILLPLRTELVCHLT